MPRTTRRGCAGPGPGSPRRRPGPSRTGPAAARRPPRWPPARRAGDAMRARCGGRAPPRAAWPTPRATADSGARELLAVAHGRPHVGLHVGEGLAEVIAVVVHPLLEQVADAQESHLRM